MKNKTNLELSREDIHAGEIETHLERIHREFKDGFEFVRRYPKSVTIFGSSVALPDNPNALRAGELAGRIVQELGYAVVTGGGQGIMGAANKGAFEAGGKSVGLSISLPHEHNLNNFTSDSIRFSYFFSRKTMLVFTAEAYVFFPGGYGTFDELFEILTLIQTAKIPRVPLLLFNSKFWNEFKHFLKKIMADEYHTIDDKDLELFHITDSMDEIISIIQKAPVFEWWRNIN